MTCTMLYLNLQVFISNMTNFSVKHFIYFASSEKLCEARSKRRSIHAPNLTNELTTAVERRLNQFGSAV